MEAAVCNMRQTYLVFLLLLVLLPAALAQTDDERIAQSRTLTLEHTTSSSIDLSYKSPDARLIMLKAHLTYFPQDSDRQEVIDLDFSPDPTHRNGSEVLFSWRDPTEGSYPFSLQSTLQTTNRIKPIPQKISFPIIDFPDEIRVYTQEAANIDFDPLLVRQANLIASGKDDLFIVVHDIADWVESNIEYSLNTVTADVSLPASWVFREKEGVCDELTALFVAMLRSVGIPARFTSGISYTSSTLFPDKWSSHAWAEVYFPDVGWVPFDITYRQFGLIDASHIRLRHAVDANSSLTKYDWVGYDLGDVDITLHPLSFATEIVESKGAFNHPAELDASLITTDVGFGSFGKFLITVENPSDTYVSVPLQINGAEEIVMEKEKVNLAIPPKSSRSVSLLFRVPQLDRNLRYDIPLHIGSQWHTPKVLWVTAGRDAPIYSRDELIDEEEKTTQDAASFALSCMGPSNVAVGHTFSLSCTIKNTGNTYFERVDICSDGTCAWETLGIAQSKTLRVPLSITSEGTHRILIGADATGAPRQEDILIIKAEERPFIQITDIDAPKEVSYGDPWNLSFVLEVSGTARDVLVKVDNGFSPIVWTVPLLEQDQEFIATFSKHFLNPGENELLIEVTYRGGQGNTYETDEMVAIDLQDISGFKAFWLRCIHFIEGLFN
jgi:transglutaminase-like putative cysteine protease